MIKITLTLIYISLMAYLPAHALAMNHRLLYLSFDLPEDWSCKMVKVDYICDRGDDGDEIFVITAKERNNEDTLTSYFSHLNSSVQKEIPAGINGISPKMFKSNPKFTKYRKTGDHRWVDSLHENGELYGYFSRYMATVSENLGIAVTYTYKKGMKASDFSFDKAVSSFKLRLRKPDGFFILGPDDE